MRRQIKPNLPYHPKSNQLFTQIKKVNLLHYNLSHASSNQLIKVITTIMQKEIPIIPQLQLKDLQQYQSNDATKRTSVAQTNSQNLIKMYLTHEILTECLQTLDIFREMLEDPTLRNKTIRDIVKGIRLKVYDFNEIIYNKGESSTSVYMVIKGSVSLCMPIFIQPTQKQSQNKQGAKYEYQEVDKFMKGCGFGQAQFINGRKRSLIAKADTDQTIIGVIAGKDFHEVIESYKQRVYYRKIDMFMRCPLLQQLYPYQLQFIVSNSKPFIFSISKEIVQEEQKPKALYLIIEGQIQLKQLNAKVEQKLSKYSTKNKTTVQEAVNEKIKIKSHVVSILEQGDFLGDGEIALGTTYNYSAVCKSQKVKAYACDERIILSQMTEANFKSARQYYLQKQLYRENKANIYQEIKSKIQKRIENDEKFKLDKKQMKMKRMISNRYVEKVPSLIGQLSPQDIGKIVDHKYSKLKQPICINQNQINYFPSIQSKTPFETLKPNERSYSPLLKRSLKRQPRKYSEANSPSGKLKTLSFSQQPQKERIIELQEQIPHSGSLLLPMRPFHKKVQSLHERLAKQYSSMKNQKKVELDKVSKRLSGANVQVKRMSQFISKIKQIKKK